MPGRRTRKSVADAAPSEGPTEYELKIQRKRAETQALLAQLKSDCAANGVALPKTPGGTVRTPTGKPQQRKRKAEPVAPTRRSTRVSKKAVEFRKLESDDEDDDGEPIVREKKFVKKSDDQLLPDEKIPHRTPRVDGRIFGPIDGVEVGAWWQYRDDCGRAGVHAPTVAGIFGGEESGAYSVAVSAGYPEDLDLGDTFTYTGSGGRELKKKNLRTAPQSSDQVLTRGNAALDKSARTGNPIRVIRGHKAAMGPLTGYRYDGIYKVVRSYQALNAEGKFKVYKFDFQRISGQVAVDYGAKERTLAEQERVEAEAEAAAAATAAVSVADAASILTEE